MEEREHEALIDREQSIADVEKHFRELLSVLRDMTNYGSNLIVRCLTTSKRELKDAVILGVILRQALAMFDAVEILVSNASVYPANVQSRALFEASVYMDWVLKTSTEERCTYYYVANLRQERVWALRTQVGSPENVSFESIMAPFGDFASATSKRLLADGKKRLDAINAVLAQPRFASIGLAFETYRQKRRLKYDPPWHAPLGPTTVRQLAKELDRLHEYDMFYSLTSEAIHATSQKSHIQFSKGHMHIEPIRHLKGIDVLLGFSMATMLHIYMSILKHYRPDELKSFGRKYIEDWRKHYLNILSNQSVII